MPDRLAVCEYLGNVYDPAVLDTLPGRLWFYAKWGLRGILFEYGLPKNFRELWTYVHSRLMWNPEQDAQALAEEFISYRFGPQHLQSSATSASHASDTRRHCGTVYP